jgi:hypothetical protein
MDSCKLRFVSLNCLSQYFVERGDFVAFRWCYFTGALIPIYYICRCTTARVFHGIEVRN